MLRRLAAGAAGMRAAATAAVRQQLLPFRKLGLHASILLQQPGLPPLPLAQPCLRKRPPRRLPLAKQRRGTEARGLPGAAAAGAIRPLATTAATLLLVLCQLLLQLLALLGGQALGI